MPSAQVAGPAPTAENLDGIWLLDEGSHLLRFDAEDGTYAIDDAGNLVDRPDDTGTYSLSGNTLAFVTTESRVCSSGDRWMWEVELLDDGHIHGVVTLDECLNVDADWAWTRVSPNNRIAGPPASSSPAADAPADLFSVRGIWLLDGGSTLLAVMDDGSYVWDDQGNLDTEPADSGTVELDGSTLRFSSGPDSVACSDDDVLVLEDVKITSGLPGEQRLDAAVRESACADLPDSVTFIRLA